MASLTVTDRFKYDAFKVRILAMISLEISRKLLMTKEFELSSMTRSFKKGMKSHQHFSMQLKSQ